jgi:hypothetical protein
MVKKVLVANRGEIALRVIRACRDLGVASVAVYSQADRGLRYVEEADEAVAIGAPRARESHFSIKRIITADRKSGADSIHPGYGFLSGNHELARAAERDGLTFIGPPAPVTSKCRCSLTPTATWSTWATGTVGCSAATKRLLRRARRGHSHRRPATSLRRVLPRALGRRGEQLRGRRRGDAIIRWHDLQTGGRRAHA